MSCTFFSKVIVLLLAACITSDAMAASALPVRATVEKDWTAPRRIKIPGGHRATSGASLARSNSAYIDMFFRGENFQLLHAKLNEENQIFEIETVPNVFIYEAPAAVSPREGVLDVAFIGLQGFVNIVSYRDGRWQDVVGANSRLSNFAPTAMATDSETVELFYAENDNLLLHATYKNGKFGPTKSLSKRSTGGPSGISVSPGVATLFIRDDRNKVEYRDIPGAETWERAVGVPFSMHTSPCVAISPKGKKLLFFKDLNNILRSYQEDGNTWKIMPIPTILMWRDAPACSSSNGVTTVIGQSENDFLITKLIH